MINRLIILFGVLLYMRQYLTCHSLRLDEAMLMWSVINVPMSEFLHQPLAYTQVAPVGFLVISKILVLLFGTGEFALRIFPLFCGITSIWLFDRVSKIYLPGWYATLALLTYVLTGPLVYWSSQAKPYICDVFFVLLCYVIVESVNFKKLKWRETIALSLLAAVLIWCSFSMIFVLPAIALVMLPQADLKKAGCIVASGAASFLLNYKLVLSNTLVAAKTPIFYNGWYQGYLNLDNVVMVYRYLLDKLYFDFFSSSIIFIVLGAVIFFKTDRKKFFLLLIPLFLLILASILQKHPLKGRLVMFLAPVFIILIVKSVEWIAGKAGRQKTIALPLLMVLIFWCTYFVTVKNFIVPGSLPNHKQNMKGVLSYVKDHRQPEDMIFVAFKDTFVFNYYAPRYGLTDARIILQDGSYVADEPSVRPGMENELRIISKAKRVWVLMAEGEDTVILNHFHQSGQLIGQFWAKQSVVYLFDLTKKTQ
jgi:hypothetical protein